MQTIPQIIPSVNLIIFAVQMLTNISLTTYDILGSLYPVQLTTKKPLESMDQIRIRFGSETISPTWTNSHQPPISFWQV